MENGYQRTIENGLRAAPRFGRQAFTGTGTQTERLLQFKSALTAAEAVVIGAGAGLSTAAGFTYGGARFERYFFDFAQKYGIRDMYSGGFYPFPDAETRWAWWARHIYFNRYVDAAKPVYTDLLRLVQNKAYFVITTNVDHQFQRAGFEKARLFYTQGDYGLFQRADGRGGETYDNADWVPLAMEAQGFVRDVNGVFQVPADRRLSMRLPHALIPTAPDGSAVTMNLRADDTFVEDAGWHRASAAYAAFLDAHAGQRVLFLELGVGSNTPVIIKYPFWQMTLEQPQATYACINYGEAYCPAVLAKRAICIDDDLAAVFASLR